ncbi:hypothetical protein [Moritella viscosa]|uniref:Uncharacterized protein n=1 Tax=Moritella viscosa TaxID=80854 RepID=A0A1L0BHC4_9GAMM|nr:hypothetical protein [Moritella viscosa]SGZ03432.1 Putative uncharacterized protein [Moritella viscosa]
MSFPKISKGTFEFYKNTNDVEILSMLQTIGVAEHVEHSFEDPTVYFSDLKQFFLLAKYQTGSKKNTQEIKYCLQCTQSSIVDNGFVYIHKDWYEGTYCYKHDCTLSIVLKTSKKASISALHDIFMGKHAVNSSFCEVETIPPLKKEIIARQGNYLAPCLVNTFKSFILDKNNKHPDDLFNKNYYSDSNLHQRHVLYKLYNSLEKSEHPVYMNFLSKNAKAKVINMGVIRSDSLREIVFKDKMSSCLDCMESRVSCALFDRRY